MRPPEVDRQAPLRTVIDRFQLRADKRLGQHFLLDPQLLRRIATAAGDLRGRTVVEVGPGPGGLTRALLEAGAARVIAIERDPRCIEALQELARAAAGACSSSRPTPARSSSPAWRGADQHGRQPALQRRNAAAAASGSASSSGSSA